MKAKNARLVISCLALAAMVIAVAPAYAASLGGVQFQASSLPVQVRGEGLTETIGAVVLQATNTGMIPSGSSVTIVYSGLIASPGSFTGTAGLSCSITLTAGCTGFSTSAANSATNGQLTVAFNSNQFFYNGDYLEVSQVRMNINSLGPGTPTVTATLSGTSALPGTNPITFTQSSVSVASIVPKSVAGTVKASAGGLQTCSIGAGTSFSVTSAEQYPAAFTSFSDETSFTPAVYTVANGSLVNIAISNVPAGLSVQAASYNVSYNGQTVVSASGGTTASVGTFGTAIVGFVGTPSVAYPTSGPGFNVSLSSSTPAIQAGSATGTSAGTTLNYLFSITGDSTSATEAFTVNFNIGVPNSGGTAISGTGTSITTLGTVLATTATVTLAPATGIVSFNPTVETPANNTVVTIGDCVSNLLFTFATTQANFDTTFVIANTSLDKTAFPSGGATAQNGTCTLTFYPTNLATGISSGAQQFTTPSINAGGVFSLDMGSSTFAGPSGVGQSGYMFAVCRFLDAHGFSYIANGTAVTGTISEGLLALVIPNTSLSSGRLANPSATCTGTSCAVVQGVTFATGGSWEGIVH